MKTKLSYKAFEFFEQKITRHINALNGDKFNFYLMMNNITTFILLEHYFLIRFKRKAITTILRQ